MSTPLNHPVTDAASVVAAIEARRSVRAFLTTPVKRALIERVLHAAACAPSGGNAQPWKVYVLQGDARDELVRKVCAADEALYQDPLLATKYREDYDYYPRHWVSPYLERRRQLGWALYGRLGISRDDKAAMHAQQQRNLHFFDAPVGLMFTVDRVMGQGSLLDYGGFLQTLMIAARAMGLHSCPQASWNRYAATVLEHIRATPEEMLVCGMALGYADPNAAANEVLAPRGAVESFTHWLG